MPVRGLRFPHHIGYFPPFEPGNCSPCALASSLEDFPGRLSGPAEGQFADAAGRSDKPACPFALRLGGNPARLIL
jgi:hypothetical protein